jgi:hypothetical protein
MLAPTVNLGHSLDSGYSTSPTPPGYSAPKTGRNATGLDADIQLHDREAPDEEAVVLRDIFRPGLAGHP